jgi:hypothetical protein
MAASPQSSSPVPLPTRGGSSWLGRLLCTPMRDLLRGSLSGRLDWRGLIASSEVSPQIKSLVRQIVRRTRLSRMEKADITTELVSHFSDGLASGQSSDQLIDEFGDARQVARLIRRSKIRNQPIARHLFRCTLLLAVCFCIVYGAVAIRFYLGQPSPRLDFIAAMNRQTGQVAQEQRAWPIYQSALTVLRGNARDPILDESVDGKHWLQIAQWIDLHQAAIEVVRQASKLPVLGLPLGDGGLSSDPRVTNVALPGGRDIRMLADLLGFDAERAREQGNGGRVESDINALADLASQRKRCVPTYFSEMVSLGILERSYDQLDRTLTHAPQVLDDAAIVRLAHRISVPQTASDLISFEGQRLEFEDFLQRAFTDDGHGDGRLSPAGWQFYRSNFSEWSTLPAVWLAQNATGALLQPASLVLMASRKQMQVEYQRLMEMNDRAIHLPLREADLDAPYEEWKLLQSSALLRCRYSLLFALVPQTQRCAVVAETELGQRDGLLIGLALELYHRRHRHYPAALEELTPELLPQVLADRITGDPLKYRLIDGKPLVYSVGVDRIDNGGTLPMRGSQPDPGAAAQWGQLATNVSGDWVLYPKPTRLAINDIQNE